MHWRSYQCERKPLGWVHISWIKNPNSNLDEENSNNTMKYQFYISDDKTHDNYFV